jgi:hypothetical protein
MPFFMRASYSENELWHVDSDQHPSGSLSERSAIRLTMAQVARIFRNARQKAFAAWEPLDSAFKVL